MSFKSKKHCYIGKFINSALIAIVLTLNACNMGYKKFYKQEVKLAAQNKQTGQSDILLEKDLTNLPDAVKKYLRYTGCVGKPKVQSVYIKASGKIRSKPTDGWMNFTSEQHNFFANPGRFFYIKARKAGIPATGLHTYKNQTATMEIKIAGLFKVVDAKGQEMNQGETVTVLNDMCFMAPASLIDKNIQWQEIDPLHVKAQYSNGNITVGAILTFDTEGRLIDFLSNDRFETTDGKVYKNYPWRTPVKEYGNFNGYRLPSKADVIYVHPEGDFCYGEFQLMEIIYNQIIL